MVFQYLVERTWSKPMAAPLVQRVTAVGVGAG